MRKFIILFLLSIISFNVVIAQDINTNKATIDSLDLATLKRLKLPEFPGGNGKLKRYLSSNLHYPNDAAKKNISGKVVIRFIVEKSGDITNIEVLDSLFPSCDLEALKVVKEMPRWVAGTLDGRKVSVRFSLPIFFKK